MRYTQTPNCHLFRYDGLADFLDAAEKGAEPKGAAIKTTGPAWCKDDFATTCRYFRTGWAEGAKAVRTQAAHIFQRVTSRIPVQETVWRVAPETAVLDIGRLMTGDPACWMETEDTEHLREAPGRRVVRVVVNLSASANVDERLLFARGAATLALVHSLELARKGVELTAVHCVAPSYGSPGDPSPQRLLEHVIPLKAFSAPANPDVLACAVAHPGSLRRVKLAVCEGHTDAIRNKFGLRNGSGYGTPDNSLSTTGDIIVPTAMGDLWHSPERIEEWVFDQLKAQGVALL